MTQAIMLLELLHRPWLFWAPFKTSTGEMLNRYSSLVGERMEYRVRITNANACRIRLPEKNTGIPFKFEF